MFALSTTTRLFFAALCLQVVICGSLQNGIVGLPMLTCMRDAMRFTFTTKKSFFGKVFVKGYDGDENCSQNFELRTFDDVNRFSFVVPHGACNMQRQRLTDPDVGVTYSSNIVVSFHGVFITKVDRAYHFTCFYRRQVIVREQLAMSMVPITELEDTLKGPDCFYEVHADAMDGPLARFSSVGSDVFHVWRCDPERQIKFLVHSCRATNGTAKKSFELFDVTGCAIDPIIIPDITYMPEKHMAFTKTTGFMFPDNDYLQFDCKIDLCLDADVECLMEMPPACGIAVFRDPRKGPRRVQRSHQLRFPNSSLLVQSSDIDRERFRTTKVIAPLVRVIDTVTNPRVAIESENFDNRYPKNSSFCTSTKSFFLLITNLCALFMFSMGMFSIFCYQLLNRWKRKRIVERRFTRKELVQQTSI